MKFSDPCLPQSPLAGIEGMNEWLKVIAADLDDLSSIPQMHMVRDANLNPQVVL